MSQDDMHAAMTNKPSMPSDIEAEKAQTAALENRVYSSNVKVQNMKCMMQNMAEATQAMQNMMISNSSANLWASGSAVKERPKNWSQKGIWTELINSNGCGHSLTSHKQRKLHKNKWAKWYLAQVWVWSLNLSQLMLVMLAVWSPPKV